MGSIGATSPARTSRMRAALRPRRAAFPRRRTTRRRRCAPTPGSRPAHGGTRVHRRSPWPFPDRSCRSEGRAGRCGWDPRARSVVRLERCRAPRSTSRAPSTFSIRSAGPSTSSTLARPRPVRTTARSPGATSPMPFDSRTTGTPGVKYGSPTISRPRRLTSTTSREESDCCVKGVRRAYVRLHAVARDVDAGRRQVAGDGELQRSARRQAARSPGRATSRTSARRHPAATVVLERARDDFRRARAPPSTSTASGIVDPAPPCE